MTATATRPPTETEYGSAAPSTQASGLSRLLASGDHKVIGALYGLGGLVFLITSLVVGLVAGAERVDPDKLHFLSNKAEVIQLFSLERFGLLFLGVLPLVLGLAIYLVPLQVGSPSLAMPRAANASFWGWLLGVGLQLGAFGINGGPWGGEPDGVDLWASATVLILVALIVGFACVATTVVAHRPPGMSLNRVPAFSWSMLVAGSMWILTLPVLAGELVLILIDRSNGSLLFGTDPETIWAQVMWVLMAPTVLLLAVPTLGIGSDVIAVNAGVRQRGYSDVLLATASFGILGFGAWARPMLADGNIQQEPLYQAMAVLAIFPVLLILGAWLDTLHRGKLALTAPVVASLFGALLLLATLGVGLAFVVPDTGLAGTTAMNGVTTAAVLVGVLGVIAGVAHWAPKFMGRKVSDAAMKLSALLVFGGGAVALAADTLAGAYDQPLTLFTGEVRSMAEIAGGYVFGGAAAATAGVLLMLLAVAKARLGSAEPVGDDPWGGQTLEWATSSPPPAFNFAQIPMVTSPTPLLDSRSPEEAGS